MEKTMKIKYLIFTGCVALSACTGGAPRNPLEVHQSFKCHLDEFAQTSICTSSKIEDDSNQSSFGSFVSGGDISMYFAKNGDKLLITGAVETHAGALVRDDSKVIPEKAFDSDGTQLVMQNAKESRSRLCMDGRCYMYAEFELLIDKKWLGKYKNTGVSIRVYTNVGSVTRTQKIPAHYIEGFLNYLKNT